jgi:hypothetical protein
MVRCEVRDSGVRDHVCVQITTVRVVKPLEMRNAKGQGKQAARCYIEHMEDDQKERERGRESKVWFVDM